MVHLPTANVREMRTPLGYGPFTFLPSTSELENDAGGYGSRTFRNRMNSRCVVADASCNFESSSCDWSTTRRIPHRDGSLDADLLWRRHRRQIAAVGPVWDRSSTDGSMSPVFNQSIKTHLYRAICRERIGGAFYVVMTTLYDAMQTRITLFICRY